MFTNDIRDLIFINGGPLTPGGPSPPLLKNAKFLIYGAIMLKFETQYFHMLTNNIWDYI